MSYNRTARIIPIFSTSKLSCVKKVQEMERRGFECIHPIRPAKQKVNVDTVMRAGTRRKAYLTIEPVDVDGWGTRMIFKDKI